MTDVNKRTGFQCTAAYSDAELEGAVRAIDEHFVSIENEVPRRLEQEEDMASQPERIATLEEQVRGLQKSHGGVSFTLFKWVIGGAVLWLGSITTMVIAIHGDIKAVKQKLLDNGLGTIVSQIDNPASPQQFDAALNLVASEVEVQRVNQIKPDPQKLAKLSAAVRSAALKQPNNPAVWQGGTRLVNYRHQRSQDSIPAGNLPSCLDSNDDWALRQLAGTSDEQLKKGGVKFVAQNCVLNLDTDPPSFAQSAAGRFFEEANRRNPGNGNIMDLSNAVVTYSAGTTMPVKIIDCKNCVFKLAEDRPGVPSKAGQFLTDQLLISDVVNTTVFLPTGI
jgi:hypothetical protein